MLKILFICHGNICRSPMAEFILKDMAEKAGIVDRLRIESAAVSSEEIWRGVGNPVYPPARAKLLEHGLDPGDKRARKMTESDYDEYDLLIGMDDSNLRRMKQICGGDPEGKMHLMLEYAGRKGSVADPWYTGDFNATWRDLQEGCKGLMEALLESEIGEN